MIQTNITLEQNLKFITKGLKFVGRFGYDTYNNNHINRRKWPEQWSAERSRDEMEIWYSRKFRTVAICIKKVVLAVTVVNF